MFSSHFRFICFFQQTGTDGAAVPVTSANKSVAASPGTPLGLTRGGGVSPGTFLQPGYKPKWNFKVSTFQFRYE